MLIVTEHLKYFGSFNIEVNGDKWWYTWCRNNKCLKETVKWEIVKEEFFRLVKE